MTTKGEGEFAHVNVTDVVVEDAEDDVDLTETDDGLSMSSTPAVIAPCELWPADCGNLAERICRRLNPKEVDGASGSRLVDGGVGATRVDDSDSDDSGVFEHEHWIDR